MEAKKKKTLYIVAGVLVLTIGVANYVTSETLYEKGSALIFVVAGIGVIFLSFHKKKED